MGTKKDRIYGKGAPFKGGAQRFGGAVAPNFPPHCTSLHYFKLYYKQFNKHLICKKYLYVSVTFDVKLFDFQMLFFHLVT